MTTNECSSLEEIRENIDLIDRDIVSLLVRRGNYVMQAAKFKNNITKVEDQVRINNIITKVTDYAKEMNFNSSVIEQIYRFLIKVYIQLEKDTFMNSK
ncbi:chorismate mutase [Candidatus Nitrosocosmicus hydrocola]|uniref:chorismate mutase n=1 Tax=Candidatus Nitrosocosmicus hydrocola TaxID=1826872 RepID=UPI0011E5D9F5|nr:chorismate mutase [Candidatus Nitrosocosmicus hydrocola]